MHFGISYVKLGDNDLTWKSLRVYFNNSSYVLVMLETLPPWPKAARIHGSKMRWSTPHLLRPATLIMGMLRRSIPGVLMQAIFMMIM